MERNVTVMELQYAIALLVSATISALVGWVAWRRRSAEGSKGLILTMAAACTWSLTYAIRWLSQDQAAQLFWLDATYLGVVVRQPHFSFWLWSLPTESTYSPGVI